MYIYIYIYVLPDNFQTKQVSWFGTSSFMLALQQSSAKKAMKLRYLQYSFFFYDDDDDVRSSVS